MFKEDKATGVTHVALSSDSTCVNNLYSAQDGYQTLHLTKEMVSQPSQRAANDAKCIFPEWMQGQWEGLTIEGATITFRDEKNFDTLRGSCRQSTIHTDRFVVALASDCGPSESTAKHFCALFQQRDVNVMEFQLGKEIRTCCFLIRNLYAYLSSVI